MRPFGLAVKPVANVGSMPMEHETPESAMDERPQTARILGTNVKTLRQARGWTQVELAGRLSQLGIDLHQTTVAKLEAGNRPVSTDELHALASVLEVEYEHLMPARVSLRDESEALRTARLTSELAQAEHRLAEQRADEASEEANRARERAEEAKQRAHEALHRFLELNAK